MLRGPKLPDLSALQPIPRPTAEQTKTLIDKTTMVHEGLQVVAKSSQHLETLTEALRKKTSRVADSSEKVEKLTATLRNLTFAPW